MLSAAHRQYKDKINIFIVLLSCKQKLKNKKTLSRKSLCRDRIKNFPAVPPCLMQNAFSLRILSYADFFSRGAIPRLPYSNTFFGSPSEVHSVSLFLLPSHHRQLSGRKFMKLTHSSSSVYCIISHYFLFVNRFFEFFYFFLCVVNILIVEYKKHYFYKL